MNGVDLRTRRLAAQWSQAELSRRSRVPAWRIAQAERGERGLCSLDAALVARVLDAEERRRGRERALLALGEAVILGLKRFMANDEPAARP